MLTWCLGWTVPLSCLIVPRFVEVAGRWWQPCLSLLVILHVRILDRAHIGTIGLYKPVDTFSSKYNGDMISFSKQILNLRKSSLFISSYTSVCVLGQPEPVGSVLTFLNGYDTPEYSWVKATAVSMRLQILFMMLQNTNKLSGTIAGERQLHYPRIQSSSYPFYFLWFFLNPRYLWSSYPFISSLHPSASSMSHQHLLTQFFPLAMNSAQAL